MEDASLWVLILDPSSHIGKLESRGRVGSRTRVSSSGVEAVRAVTESSCLVKVVVIEASTIDGEILRPWRDDTVRRRRISLSIGVGRLSNDDSIDNLGIAVNHIFSQRELNTSQKVISCLELVELNGTDTLSDGTVSSILPGGQPVELGGDNWVRMVRVARIRHVGDKWLARELTWDQVMEDSETVASA